MIYTFEIDFDLLDRVDQSTVLRKELEQLIIKFDKATIEGELIDGLMKIDGI